MTVPLFAMMFHHFHGGQIEPSQGSISSVDLARLVKWLQNGYSLIGPEHYTEKVLENNLEPRDVCLTFDDALKSQIEIAVPVLQRFKIKAFFFVYSGAFTEMPDTLEFYRDFRNSCFGTIEEFYQKFFALMKKEYPELYHRSDPPIVFLSEFPFYTEGDRKFRFCRDNLLSELEYSFLMESMMNDSGYDREARKSRLFMSVDDLVDLKRQGHALGLHSHTHPTTIEKLPVNVQKSEYSNNYSFLKDIIGYRPWAMSHPCGRYSEKTLGVLNSLGITIGFRSSLSKASISSSLEIPREDHSNVIGRLV